MLAKLIALPTVYMVFIELSEKYHSAKILAKASGNTP